MRGIVDFESLRGRITHLFKNPVQYRLLKKIPRFEVVVHDQLACMLKAKTTEGLESCLVPQKYTSEKKTSNVGFRFTEHPMHPWPDNSPKPCLKVALWGGRSNSTALALRKIATSVFFIDTQQPQLSRFALLLSRAMIAMIMSLASKRVPSDETDDTGVCDLLANNASSFCCTSRRSPTCS